MIREKKTFQDKVVTFFKNNILLVLIWMIIVLSSSAITLIQNGQQFLSWYQQSIGYKQQIYNKLGSLSTNVTIEVFIEQLGKPEIIDVDKDAKNKEYIFINKFYYLDVLTQEDKVISYAVTTRTKDFQPSFIPPGKDASQKITLNKNTFSDITNAMANKYYHGSIAPDYCFLNIGVRRFGYFEGIYEANPGNYQSIYYGINDAGYLGNNKLSQLDPGYGIEVDQCDKISSDFRTSSVFNTYMVTAPDEFEAIVASDTAKIKFGVNADEVRVVE